MAGFSGGPTSTAKPGPRPQLQEALAAQALLLGRYSADWFATRWLRRAGEWAQALNRLPKYVVSSTLHNARWSNATVLGGALLDEISAVKDQVDGDIVVYASIQLVHALTEHDLVDELRLTVHPVVLGSGRRIFTTTSTTTPLRLVGRRSLAHHLVHLTYQPVRDGDAGAVADLEQRQ